MSARYYLLYAAVFLSVYACKKTNPLPAQRQDRILEYKVTNLSDSAIYGAINDDSSTITVYLPFYLNLQVIDPAVTVSEGASIQNEVLPVAVTDTTTIYTVKGKDGSQAVYRLKIVVQAPPLVLQELSQPGDTSAYAANGFILGVFGNFNTVALGNFSLQLSSDATGKLYPMSINSTYTSVILIDGAYTLQQPQIPANIDSGLYHLHVTMFGQVSAAMVYPIRIYYPAPDIIPMYTTTPRQGETCTLTANYSSILRGLTSFSILVNGVYVPLNILSYTNASAVIQVPESIPPGTYNNFQLICSGYDPKIYANGSRGSITVLVK